MVARRRPVYLASGLVALLAGCQQILGFDSDRPLVADAGPAPVGDAGDEGDAGGRPAPGDAGVDATDSSTPPSDAAASGDASDAAVPDAELDAPSFTNPVQIDVTSLFNANTVVTTAEGGAPLQPMDGAGTSGNDDFPTLSEIETLGESKGLPDDALFASNGATMPNVQLWWSNAQNVDNSVVVSATASTPFDFSLPLEIPYQQVQLYATAAGIGTGGNTLNYGLRYADGSSTSSSLALQDWCLGNTSVNGQYLLVGVYRVQNGKTLNAQNPDLPCYIYALDLNPDTSKALKSVTFSDTGTEGNFVFYGATAW